jgi:hypothetical protein
MNKGCDTRSSTVQHTKDKIGEFLKKIGKLSNARTVHEKDVPFVSGEDTLLFLLRGDLRDET